MNINILLFQNAPLSPQFRVNLIYIDITISVHNGIPLLTKIEESATEIKLYWNPPEYGEINELITQYRISYNFINKTCFDDENGQGVTTNISLSDNSTTYTLKGLYPYTDYYIQIKAFTCAGGGPYSNAVKISTKQSSNTFHYI